MKYSAPKAEKIYIVTSSILTGSPTFKNADNPGGEDGDDAKKRTMFDDEFTYKKFDPYDSYDLQIKVDHKSPWDD